MASPAYVLVLRVWREPGGHWVGRVVAQVEPGEEPSFDRAAAPADVPAVVGEWLALVTAR